MKPISMLVLVSLWLNGCAHVSQTLISLDGSPVTDLSKVAVVVEDADHPLLLRGLDGHPVDSMRVPNAFANYAYLMKSGHHEFWVRDLPVGHPVWATFERIRCYVIEAELERGMKYRLKEDTDRKIALLLSHETGIAIATGQLVDEPWIVSRGCQWKKPSPGLTLHSSVTRQKRRALHFERQASQPGLREPRRNIE